jgi:hypothetical protein
VFLPRGNLKNALVSTSRETDNLYQAVASGSQRLFCFSLIGTKERAICWIISAFFAPSGSPGVTPPE